MMDSLYNKMVHQPIAARPRQISYVTFITKDEWPPNSPDLSLLDYCV